MTDGKNVGMHGSGGMSRGAQVAALVVACAVCLGVLLLLPVFAPGAAIRYAPWEWYARVAVLYGAATHPEFDLYAARCRDEWSRSNLYPVAVHLLSDGERPKVRLRGLVMLSLSDDARALQQSIRTYLGDPDTSVRVAALAIIQATPESALEVMDVMIADTVEAVPGRATSLYAELVPLCDQRNLVARLQASSETRRNYYAALFQLGCLDEDCAELRSYLQGLGLEIHPDPKQHGSFGKVPSWVNLGGEPPPPTNTPPSTAE